MEDAHDEDDDLDQLQAHEDDQVTSFGVDVYQQVFTVDTTTPGAVGDNVHPQQSQVPVVDVLARLERMRQLHEEYLAAE